ncbi:LysM peptidoglycan-binding domain-containing protein [Streptomyces sp. MZ04]|nr:LysM peptidoglycan-binding domain-containing protein [Streptomyces sp. MZ04]
MFLGAITLIGWYGWFTFVVSVVLEAISVLRHRTAPRIKLLGSTQQLAGALIGGIVVLLPTGSAFAASTPAAAATVVSAPATVDSAHAPPTAKTSAPVEKYSGPTHTVKARESLWELAEHYLSSGADWHRIVEANKGASQADGSVITQDTTVLRPGWVLRLPADAAPAPSADTNGMQTQTERTTASPTSHTVRPGETLSSIAQDELGEANAYPEIVELNDGVQQPDGATLTDPDEIYPGWKLKLPAAHDGNDPSDSETSAPPRERRPSPERGGEQQGGSTDKGQPSGQDKQHDQGKQQEDGEGGGQATARPKAPAEQPDAQTPTSREPAGQPATDAPDEQAPAAPEPSDGSGESVTTIAAAGSILAAAVLAVIATRRARQQRRRRAKRRIPMPSGATADFEKQLRATSDITGTLLADRALRTLALNCREAGRPLPEVEAMRITARGVELHLAAATPPIAPFTEREDNPGLWWCPGRGSALLDEHQAADIAPPYPALVSLGETEDGDAVLVDLESIGLLQLAGHPADVRAVMLALAVELASSKLAPATQIVLAGAGSDLHHLYPDQINHHTDLGGATAELQSHDAFQREALADGGHDHLRAARLSEETSGDTWIPRILLSTAPATGPTAARLEDLLVSRPRTSVAVVAAAGTGLDLPGAWTLPAKPGTAVELPGLDLAVKLQYLDDAAYGRLIQLLATSSRTDDVPPPAWTGHTGQADPNGPQGTVESPGEASALAPETSWSPHPPANTPAPTGDLTTALPDFTSLVPTVAPEPSPAPGDDTGPVEDEGDSALSPAVAGPSAAADTTYGVVDQNRDAALAPAAADGDESAHEDEPEPVEIVAASAPGTAVFDGGTPATDFDSVLGEVLAGQDDGVVPAPHNDGEEAETGLSPAALGTSEAEPAASEARIIPRPSAATSTVLAALSTPPPAPKAPQVQVLGPVALVGARGRVGSNRRNSILEIAAYLVLHPSLGRQDLDDAIWPGMRITAGTRNTAISRLRSWLGQAPHLPADDPHAAYLPPIKGGIYQLSDRVSCDWDRFRELYQQGMHHDGPDADIALAHALALVRGRPFADVDPSKYTWAEADIQEMISAIVDVAHELAEQRRQVRDYRAAAQAVTKGMLVDNQSELLYRDLFTICHEMGDREGLERAAHQLARINAEEGIDSSPETVGLLRTLLKGERAQPTWGSAVS